MAAAEERFDPWKDEDGDQDMSSAEEKKRLLESRMSGPSSAERKSDALVIAEHKEFTPEQVRLSVPSVLVLPPFDASYYMPSKAIIPH